LKKKRTNNMVNEIKELPMCLKTSCRRLDETASASVNRSNHDLPIRGKTSHRLGDKMPLS
jgi:hypothetical protein